MANIPGEYVHQFMNIIQK